jgi:uncharacterized protein
VCEKRLLLANFFLKYKGIAWSDKRFLHKRFLLLGCIVYVWPNKMRYTAIILGLATTFVSCTSPIHEKESQMTMKPRLNVVTLTVADLEKSLAFYRDGLGLPTKGIIGSEFKGSDIEPSGTVAFFELQGGLILALYPRAELVKDSNLPDSRPSALEFSLGYIVESRDAVDKLLRSAEAAGAKLTEKPHDRPWGIYSGYFQDLDGHLWEILWNPQIQVKD